MIDPLKIAKWSRWMPGIAYMIAVALAGYGIYQRTLPPPALATQNLQRNHVIGPGDLETSNITPLRGQYLRKDVKLGEAVTQDMVAPKQLPPRIENTMAAVVTIPVGRYRALSLKPGDEIQICVNANPFGGMSKVLTVDCDEQVCTIFAKLPKMANQPVDPGALIDARIAIAQNCAGP